MPLLVVVVIVVIASVMIPLLFAYAVLRTNFLSASREILRLEFSGRSLHVAMLPSLLTVAVVANARTIGVWTSVLLLIGLWWSRRCGIGTGRAPPLREHVATDCSARSIAFPERCGRFGSTQA